MSSNEEMQERTNTIDLRDYDNDFVVTMHESSPVESMTDVSSGYIL